MALSKSEFDRRGVSVVIISFAEPTTLVPYQEQHRWPFTILADPERKVYRAFELKRFSWFRVFSPPVLKLYFKLWRRGLKQEAYGGEDIYQSGGDFLLDSAKRSLRLSQSEPGGSAGAEKAAAGNRSRPTGAVPLTPLLTGVTA